jgi:hypothetical protein
MKDDYVIVTVSFEVGVTVRREIDKSYGADADGYRGTGLIERHAVNAEVHTEGGAGAVARVSQGAGD